MEITQTQTPYFVKRFYLMEYFYILLKSVESYSTQQDVFDSFRKMKKEYQLGESKYKKITTDEDEELTTKQIIKFRYTFEQVLSESLDYELVEMKSANPFVVSEKMNIKKENELDRSKNIYLTKTGKDALLEYDKGKYYFNLFLFKLMEYKHGAFYNLIKLLYADKTLKNGLLIFPIYSGLKLGFNKSIFTTNQHVYDYSKALMKQLEKDIKNYTNKDISLVEAEEKFMSKLKQDSLITDNPSDVFPQKEYNAVLSKFRKYWLNYFLNQIYEYKHSFSTFSIWIERAKQIGILHTTEFFPDFSGRLVFPTSVIHNNIKNSNFEKIYKYPNEEVLCIHKPHWESNQENFLRTLQEEFLFLQRTRKTHFINLLDLKERVCFKMRIPGFVFDDFLEKAYMLNMEKETRVTISLEADRLPEETKAMYLKRESILINGKYKNIISINYGGKQYE